MNACALDGPTRRYERRNAIARNIERAALDLSTQRGYTEVSADDAAAVAGISLRTFFRYFDNKSDVLLGYRRLLDQRLLEALRKRPAGDGPISALRNACIATSAVAEPDREMVLLRARAVATAPALLARSRGEQMAGTTAIAAGLALRMGARHDDPRPRIAATAMAAVADAEWEAWVASKGEEDPAGRIAATLDIVERGLGDFDQATTGGRR